MLKSALSMAHSSRPAIGIALLVALFAATPVSASQIQACFSPPLPSGCDPMATVVRSIDGAQRTVLVQMYALTSREIVTALVNAKRRGIDVRAIMIGANSTRTRATLTPLVASGGVPVFVDTVLGLMHDKIMIIDGATVVTGSFNYTWSAEHKNAENLLVIHDSAVAAEYTQNWNTRAARSTHLKASTSPVSVSEQTTNGQRSQRARAR